MKEIVCDEAARLLLQHFKSCPRCKEGIGGLLSSYPFINTFFPGLAEKHRELMKELEADERKAVNV